MDSTRPTCAQSTNDAHDGNLDNLMACKGCLMVLYCSRKCQKADWDRHKQDCKSPWMRQGWRPAWEVERRSPAFINNDKLPYQSVGPTQKYLWGNMGAIDIVALSKNEGVAYSKPLNLLFAASGDPRNIIKSVAALPEQFTAPLNVVVNDFDFDIVARNAILLLLAFLVDDPVQAAECAVQIWYSVLVPKACMDLLTDKIKPLIQDVCTKVSHKPGGVLQGKTWTFGRRSLRLVLAKERWFDLLSFFDVPEGLTAEEAQKVRASVMRARPDHLDRDLISKPPHWRMAAVRFREDGIFLPFGHSRARHTLPNPTFYQANDQWPMMDSSDPLHGWSIAEVLRTEDVGAAKNDLYGRLFYHVRNTFAQFHRRLASSEVSFKLFFLNALDLPRHLEGERFDRIEVSNISDGCHLGISRTLAVGASLLRSRVENEHATLISLFLNAVEEMFRPDEASTAVIDQELRRLRLLLPTVPRGGPNSAEFIQLLSSRTIVRDGEKYFQRYMESEGFEEVASLLGMEMKDKYTIVEPWPMKLKEKPPSAEATREFELLSASGKTGLERYVEWTLEQGSLGDEIS